MIVASFVIVICYFTTCGADECEPSFADSCFSDVKKTVSQITDSANSRPRNASDGALKSLCYSINDALNCTSDIIDTNCDESQGRVQFDSWNNGLRGASSALCDQNMALMKGNIHCWDASRFLTCVTIRTRLTEIKDLMQTPLEPDSCYSLDEVFNECNAEIEKLVTVRLEFCDRISYRKAMRSVNLVLHRFLDSSHCSQYKANAGCILLATSCLTLPLIILMTHVSCLFVF